MPNPCPVTRRSFLRTTTTGFVLSSLLPRPAWCADEQSEPLTIGLIADLHHGNLTPDADARLDVFLQAVADRGDVDLLVQLGDFCHPTQNARELCKRFNSFEGLTLHVLGNHDMDLGTKRQIMEYWGMPARYGSTDIGGYHFVTLDRNNLKTEDGYEPYANANFYVKPAVRAWADAEQLKWLAGDLARSKLPTIILTHQPLGLSSKGVENAGPQVKPVMQIIEKANADAGWTKIQACFCGHNHIDRATRHQDIHYVHFNSASYRWLKEPVRYRDALYAFVTLDPSGAILVEGRSTVWAKPTPSERNLEGAPFADPAISDRKLKVPRRPMAGVPSQSI